MSNKKELSQTELEEVSGGSGIDNTIYMVVGLSYKLFEDGEVLYREINLVFHKKFTTKVPDREIETECKAWCNNNCCLYESYVVKNSYVQ